MLCSRSPPPFSTNRFRAVGIEFKKRHAEQVADAKEARQAQAKALKAYKKARKTFNKGLLAKARAKVRAKLPLVWASRSLFIHCAGREGMQGGLRGREAGQEAEQTRQEVRA